MESIIFLIIMFIISLFSKKKKADQTPNKKAQQMKPIAEDPFQDLREFAKGFKMEQKQEMERKKETIQTAPVEEVRVQREVNRDQGVPRSSGRLSIHQEKKQEKKTSRPTKHQILPSSKDELVRAIIFSEILAPPKSRR